jgi:inorganic phosphate transporter, PiT family
MNPLWIIVIATIVVALIFDVLNGFHDAANSIATVVSTRVLSPRVAVIWAAFFNFVAMFVFPAKVADTVSKIVIVNSHDEAYVYVVLAGLVGAIVWDLLTWWWGLPTSSSHALIGGLAGAGVAHAGWSALRWDKVLDTVKFIPLAPLMGMALAAVLVFILYWLLRAARPAKVDAFFRRGQLVSAALYSLGHGGNDAQKTMGIILALLVAAGIFDQHTVLKVTDPHTLWIILACHAAMAFGTAMGGWRIVRTMGMKITKLQPYGGFCAETAGAATLFMATRWGVPVSTTHTITGAIIGVGSVRRLSAVKWGISMRIVWAWLLTIPAAALTAAAVYYGMKAVVPSF